MIQSIKLKNFRNFQDEEFYFCDWKNIIVWDNGKGKTNILEALSLFSNSSIVELSFDNLISRNADVMYIEAKTTDRNILSISYDKTLEKKKYMLGGKNTTKKKLREAYPTSVLFEPMSMNIMYLSPTLRRDFLDNVLWNCFPQYTPALKNYKNILKSRNKVLKNISEWKWEPSELNFWDERFISAATDIYNHRKIFVKFLQENTHKLIDIFWGKIQNISFEYITKTDLWDIENYIREYLENNRNRDIIIWKTMTGPHRDDFDIHVDQRSLTDFASRWEVKSVILWIKFLETEFIEKITGKSPIILIDDILSELDDIHKNYVIDMSGKRQVIISSIEIIESIDKKIILQ